MSDRWEPPARRTFGREAEVAEARRLSSKPDVRVALETIVDGWIALCEERPLPPEAVVAMCLCLGDRAEPVWSTAGKRLAQCAHYAKEAAVAFHASMEHPKAIVRFNTVASVLHRPPRDVAAGVLRAGLGDEVRAVRERAAQVAGELELDELLPDLRARLEAENEAQVQAALRAAIDALGG